MHADGIRFSRRGTEMLARPIAREAANFLEINANVWQKTGTPRIIASGSASTVKLPNMIGAERPPFLFLNRPPPPLPPKPPANLLPFQFAKQQRTPNGRLQDKRFPYQRRAVQSSQVWLNQFRAFPPTLPKPESIPLYPPVH